MRLVQRPSPNHGPRPAGVPISCIVLHATADTNTLASVEWCCTPKPKNPDPVSYHAIVDRDGTVFALVPAERRAWHAGVSTFLGVPNCNDYAIGLSFGNRNDGAEPYPSVQLQVGAALCAEWMRRFPAITLERITTHREVAPGRKTDPMPPAFNAGKFRALVALELARAA